MSVEHTSTAPRGAAAFEENQGVYAALFSKINLSPISELSGLDAFQNNEALSEASADERVTAAVSVFLDLLKQSSQKVERLDKTLLDEHIASSMRRSAASSMRSCITRISSASNPPGAASSR